MSPMIPSKLTPSAAAPAGLSSAATEAGSAPLVEDPLNDLARLGLTLAAAAEAAVEAGVPLEDFMRQAWSAYVDSRPGLREHLADAQLMQQIQDLRSAGKVGLA